MTTWAAERLGWLNERMSQRAISRLTQIPQSTISRAIREQQILPARYVQTLRNAYARTVYSELRAQGLSTSIARAYRWRSPSILNQFMQESTTMVEQLAQYRLQTYNQYLQREGRYISDEDTLNTLRRSIRESIAKSPIDMGKHEGQDSPSLVHIVTIDDDQ